MWPRANTLLLEGETNPFDTISTLDANECLNICHNKGYNGQCFFSHSGSPYLICFQRLAIEAGIGIMEPISRLIMHPTFGSWFALRFALVIEIYTVSNLQEAVSHYPSPWQSFIANTTNTNIITPLESELAKEILEQHEKAYNAEVYLRCRKVFSHGREEYMYCKEQIAYHYNLEKK